MGDLQLFSSLEALTQPLQQGVIPRECRHCPSFRYGEAEGLPVSAVLEERPGVKATQPHPGLR